MLEYQKQNCDLTLQEGLECYYNSFPETTEIFGDNNAVSYTHLRPTRPY